jgi:hypothetical protein
MTVIYYDTTYPKEQMYDMVRQVKEITKDEVIMLPKNFDILLDCTLDQLISVKGILDTAIALKLKMDEPDINIPQ